MTTTTGPDVDPLAALRAATVVAVLRAPSAEAGIRATAALIAGGVTGIEITYSTPDAAAVIREVRAQHGDGVYLGAGTVLEPAQAAEAVEAGAEFLVSPGTEPKLAAAMLDTGAIVLSGALTPSEVMATLACGVHVVKLFPASLGGPAYLKALRAPVPGRRLRADRRRRRGQPRRLAGGGRGRRRSRRGPVPARGHGRGRLGHHHRDRPALHRRGAAGPGAAGMTRGARVVHGLRRGQHRRLVHPEGVPGVGRRPPAAHPHAGRPRRRPGLAGAGLPRGGGNHPRRPAALGRPGHHAQDGRARGRPRPVRRLRRTGRDVR